MSWQACRWAARTAKTQGGSEKCVLLVMAEIADEEGRGVRVSQSTLVERCEFAERTVRRALEGLEKQGLIRRGDQSLVQHLPAGQRPVVWDLAVGQVAVPAASSEDTDTLVDTPPDPGHSDPSPRSPRPLTLVTVTGHPGQDDPSPRPQWPVNPGQDDRSTPATVADKASYEASGEASREARPKTTKRGTKPKTSRRKPETSLPDSWKPNEGHNNLAKELGLSTAQARAELEKFKDHVRSKDIRYRDWNFAFRNWLRKAVEFGLKPAHGREPSAAPMADPRTGNLVEPRW
ncbi:helix-turn-helix domain-containing protein [Nocardia sp. BMG51109]|uniref:helix-turn-helix domain-containing protein n=1 Tax=Nocardia sp. BMG51109 TaxID=1056816 RepID=UPI0018DC45BB|nr:helix-turn-helix domain-containing protein [Nocardia sp. BMG51109]